MFEDSEKFAIQVSENGLTTFFRGSVPQGAIRVTAEEWLEAHDEAAAKASEQAIASQPRITFKADIYRRCTDAEAEAIEVALASASVRQRRLFESAQYLDHSDEAFAFASEAMIGMFGEKRAEEILAAS